MFNKLILKLQSKQAEMYVSKVVWTLGLIIVGMALVWGVLSITNVIVLPGLEEAIETVFGTADTAAGNVASGGTYPGAKLPTA